MAEIEAKLCHCVAGPQRIGVLALTHLAVMRLMHKQFFFKENKEKKKIGPQQAFCIRVLFSLAEAYSCCPAHWPVSKAHIVLDGAQQSLRVFFFESEDRCRRRKHMTDSLP